MLTDITPVTVLVEDTDEVIDWDAEKFGFEIRSDEEFGPGIRWVTVAPPDGHTELVLQEPDPEFHGEERASRMRSRIGKGTTTVLATDDCRETVAKLEDSGVTIVSEPEEVPWGIHGNVTDLYGDDLNEPAMHSRIKRSLSATQSTA